MSLVMTAKDTYALTAIWLHEQDQQNDTTTENASADMKLHLLSSLDEKLQLVSKTNERGRISLL